MRYYVDTCVWLNLFQKEGEHSDLTELALSRLIRTNAQICYSGEVLKELRRKLGHKYAFVRKELEFFSFVDLLPEDMRNARILESVYAFELSFADLIHLCIAKRIGATLVTRDKQLMVVCKEQGVLAEKPEEL